MFISAEVEIFNGLAGKLQPCINTLVWTPAREQDRPRLQFCAKCVHVRQVRALCPEFPHTTMYNDL